MTVYLDNNASTVLDERVLEAMRPYLAGPLWGNASSLHRHGRVMRSAVERAREQVARAVNAHPDQVIFTSGGTESNNLAVLGVAAAAPGPGRLLISAVEHASLREPAHALARRGWRVEEWPVDGEGRLRLDAVDPACGPAPALVSVMAANNENGVLQPVAEAAALWRPLGVPVHCDAAQALGKVPVDFGGWGVQLMTLSAHKLHGPQGVGALVVSQGAVLRPLLYGGRHERGLRPGTENVAGIVGFGAAAELAVAELAERAAHMAALRDRFEAGLRRLPGAVIFGDGAERLPNTVQFGLRGCHGETVLLQLDRAGIAVSSGSACHSGVNQPSHVLLAMGVAPELALTAVRVSFSPRNRAEDVDRLLAALAEITATRCAQETPA